MCIGSMLLVTSRAWVTTLGGDSRLHRFTEKTKGTDKTKGTPLLAGWPTLRPKAAPASEERGKATDKNKRRRRRDAAVFGFEDV